MNRQDRSATVLRGERGSIPLALLVVIIMGGLLTVTLSRSIVEQRSTRVDNEFTTAVHAAEVGLNDALFRLNNRLVAGTSGADTGVANGYAYNWNANVQPDGSWVIRSTGTGPNAVRRTVESQVRDRPIFAFSLATHLSIDFAGGNRADSYRSHTVPQVRCSPPSSWQNCRGWIASNGNIDVGSSGSSYMDQVHVHDMANPVNNSATRCTPTGSAFCAAPWRVNHDDPLDIRGQVSLTQAMLNACTAAQGFTSWTASTYAPGSNETATLQASQFKTAQVVVDETLRTVLCASQLTFDRHTRLPAALTPATGYLIVVRDRMLVNGATEVNCVGCSNGFPAAGSMPRARLLNIFTLAEDQPGNGNSVIAGVQIRQHAKVGAAIYAPDSSCGNQQSNAQVEIYGSLICKTVLNQGGWQFHYDEALLDGVSTGQYFVERWSEL